MILARSLQILTYFVAGMMAGSLPPAEGLFAILLTSGLLWGACINLVKELKR